MITLLTWIIAPLILLGVLILVHELGHFLACRLVKVKVERFSIGFGPKLLSWKGRETEYQIAAIPLGGYVKPLGEEPGEEISAEDWKRSLPGKSAPARFLIFFAGSLANLLLPIPLFWMVLMVGQPHLAPEVGTVFPGSPAEVSGLSPGDRILSINETGIRTFEDFSRFIRENPGKELVFSLRRGEKTEELLFVPEPREGKNLLGESVTEGYAGVLPGEITSRVGISAGSPAAEAGLRTGDLVTRVDETSVNSFREMRDAIATSLAGGSPVALTVERDGSPRQLVLTPGPREREAPGETLPTLGIHSPELFIAEVLPEHPAERAGLRPGDHILAVDGKSLTRWDELVDLIQDQGAVSHEFLVARGEERFTLSATPEKDPENLTPAGQPTFRIGIRSWTEYTSGTLVTIREGNPFVALYRASRQTFDFTVLTVRGIVALIRGSIPWKNVGSPILIAKLAVDSARSGWYPYLYLLIIISINLGIINLLPIPILDGGQITILLVETVTRNPLSPRAREITQKIGLALVLLIIALAVYNDLLRFLG